MSNFPANPFDAGFDAANRLGNVEDAINAQSHILEDTRTELRRCRRARQATNLLRVVGLCALGATAIVIKQAGAGIKEVILGIFAPKASTEDHVEAEGEVVLDEAASEPKDLSQE